MARYIDLDGDRWVVSRDRRAAHPGRDALVFNCISDIQRPHRVIELPADPAGEGSSVDYSDGELRDLFERAHTMDYTWDESAEPDRHGNGRRGLT